MKNTRVNGLFFVVFSLMVSPSVFAPSIKRWDADRFQVASYADRQEHFNALVADFDSCVVSGTDLIGTDVRDLMARIHSGDAYSLDDVTFCADAWENWHRAVRKDLYVHGEVYEKAVGLVYQSLAFGAKLLDDDSGDAENYSGLLQLSWMDACDNYRAFVS